jgi:hypothetical protein
MGCAQKNCPNCGTSTKECQLRRASDGKLCCTKCISAYEAQLQANKRKLKTN